MFPRCFRDYIVQSFGHRIISVSQLSLLIDRNRFLHRQLWNIPTIWTDCLDRIYNHHHDIQVESP
ncbi:hypothetical protein PEX1_035750 [Penicillium expansum]|uniref:Uncharacterized protein n=1 Tax=Penicillium expansum TaxID=27334 RepID=A0A0A2KHP2_PENEN|nr:hypothetical protein PEX2_001810 [Penicillium expansum]KGO48678.1 hypothetical protein PEXP_074080 [Penicillium expansum]KGO57207.1 hypothetical protein PEX2_001810 [Penicillium expansum]KGO67322.1 hypothetical protein PEX1_035750 [Penicillium expansum]